MGRKWAIIDCRTRLISGHFTIITNWTSRFKDINGLTMTKFTPEDLLLYLYKETSEKQTADIEEALKKDWTLREKLAVLKTSMQRLDKIVTGPRTEVILNVLNYAREKSAEEVK
jgi:hypothetical protein